MKATVCCRPVNNGASVTYKALGYILLILTNKEQGELKSHFPSLQQPFEIGGVDNKEVNFGAQLAQSAGSDSF